MNLRQKQLLQKLLIAEDALGDILKQSRIRPATLLRWLEDPAFAAEVKRLRRQLAKRRELEVSLGAASAAARLRRATDDPAALKNTQQRRACVELVKLARDGKPAVKKPAGEAPPPLDAALVAELTR